MRARYRKSPRFELVDVVGSVFIVGSLLALVVVLAVQIGKAVAP